MTRHERPLSIVLSVDVAAVSVHFQELREAGLGPDWFADEDARAHRSPDGSVSGKGVAGRLADHIVRVSSVGGVIQL